MLQHSNADASLGSVQNVIANHKLLNDSIVDIDQYDDTLVIYTHGDVPDSFMRLMLQKAWTGPIEVYCTSSLMGGSDSLVL